MKQRLRHYFWSMAVCFVVAAPGSPDAGGAAPATDNHVVLITIDGFPASVFWDAKTPIPRIRRLAIEGVAADAMHVSNPSVTWPNHTTLVTGVQPEKHAVLFNGILLRAGPGLPVSVDPKKDRIELVTGTTLFDVLHQGGMRTAAINWPCTRNSVAIDDDFPDTPETLRYTTPRLRQELVSEHILAEEGDAAFRGLTGPGRDQVWTQAACHVIRQRKPHLLVLHLLNTDGIHHKYGPQSPASYTALALADFYVGQVLEAIDSAGIRPNTTILVTADHGFAGATNVLQPNVLLRRAGLLEVGSTNQIVKARAQVIPEGGTGMVYLTDPATRATDRQRVLELFASQEGIAEILSPPQFAAYGLPLPEKNQGMADLVLVAREGYAIGGSAAGDRLVEPVGLNTNLGYHGYVASFPSMNAFLVVAGRMVKHGGKIGPINNIDIAPTIAHLLGIGFPSADGKILTSILQDPE